LPDDQIELKVLHRWIQRLLDGRGEAVNLVDEENIVLLEVHQDGGEVTGMGQDETGGRP
jgi:hypothetical protein